MNGSHDKEHQRDRKSAEADELLHQHHRFADSVALFQVAIALGAVAALTRMRLVWFGSMNVLVPGCAASVLAERTPRSIGVHPTFGYRWLWAMLRFCQGVHITGKPCLEC